MSLNFCFIGAGNLAVHLSKAFQNKGFKVSQVYGRSEHSAKFLANRLSTKYTTSIKKIDKTADVYFIALKDSVFDEVISQINFGNKMLVHCSGSLPLSVLEKYSENTGVFYPLQTFSKSREIDFSEIPVFIEANSAKNEKLLIEIATQISGSVSVIDYEKRKILHISAVFVSNFANYFYTIAGDILKSKEISFRYLKPLIMETANKVQEMEPETAQTGPAVRFDENIINDHFKVLKDFPEYQQLYMSVSKSIFNRYNK